MTGLIILAEDNQQLRKMYTDYLTHNGFSVMTANDGTEVLPMLQNISPRLIILDIMMPHMDGVETCRQIRKILGGDVPILFLTASDDLNCLQDCMKAGGNDFMIKSSSLDTILKRVCYWTKSSSRTRKSRKQRDKALTKINSVIETDKINLKLREQADLDSLIKDKKSPRHGDLVNEFKKT